MKYHAKENEYLKKDAIKNLHEFQQLQENIFKNVEIMAMHLTHCDWWSTNKLNKQWTN